MKLSDIFNSAPSITVKRKKILEEVYECLVELHGMDFKNDNDLIIEKIEDEKFSVIWNDHKFNILFEKKFHMIEIEEYDIFDINLPDEKEFLGYLKKRLRSEKIKRTFAK